VKRGVEEHQDTEIEVGVFALRYCVDQPGAQIRSGKGTQVAGGRAREKRVLVPPQPAARRGRSCCGPAAGAWLTGDAGSRQSMRPGVQGAPTPASF
jgi:hypothetical protein